MFVSTVDKWQAMSTVLPLNVGNPLSMEHKAGIICWDRHGKLEEFSSKELAINYAKKKKINFEIIEPRKRKTVKKSYADNFLR